jgi:phosphoribosylaminoimidazolecarboxamide formyltransferase/IMP cyclohydrolase
VTTVAIKRALISVYDKTGLADLARGLHAAGVEIVSTGSTAAAVSAAGVPVTAVEELTGFPECLDGRVKTLHPAVHAGLLADLAQPAHQAQLTELGIAPFELLVSNLYPFEAAVASGAAPEECVEQIDIGGPAMVRAAAKNHSRVTVITDPLMYEAVLEAVAAGGFTLEQRRRFAARAYARTAAYDCAVASWFASAYAPDETARETGWPDVTGAVWTRRDVLRYGENPHQRAALYQASGGGPDSGGAGITAATQLHGKAMSYNNYVDAAAAWRDAFDFTEPCVAIIKHSNPCGIAVGADLAEAHRKANACDPDSAFGGVIAVNGVVTSSRRSSSPPASIRMRSTCWPRGRTCGCWRAPRRRRPGARSGARSTGACCSRRRTSSTRPEMTRSTGCSRPARPRPARPWPTWPSPGGPAGR